MSFTGSSRLDALPPYVYVEIHRRTAEARAKARDVIDMGKGDPDIPTPPHIVAALIEAVENPINHRYPEGMARGLPQFRAAISAWYRRRYAVSIDPETEVVPLMGSKEGNLHFCMGVLNPGDMVLVPDPAFPAYEVAALLAGAEVVKIPLRAGDGFLIDFDAIPSGVAARARAIWMSYPNNPTAALASTDFYARAVEFGAPDLHHPGERQSLCGHHFRTRSSSEHPIGGRSHGGGRRVQQPVEVLQHDRMAKRYGGR